MTPENFVRHSRPPWFPARTQQDCCEFVHYLMDKLEEEDKSLLQDKVETATQTTNIVEEHFKGVLCVTYECMSCGNESKRKEDFTDILLAFPEVMPINAETPNSSNLPPQEENPKSLKGGDQVRNLQDSRYNEDSFETSKEKASNIQTTPKSSTDSSNIEKHDVRKRSTFTISEMLDYFMKPEQLTGNNQYFCDECRANVDAERRVQITKLPKFLVLSLKRFSFDIKSQTKPKLLHVVNYPEELTFCSVGESILLESKISHEDEEIAMKVEGENQAMDTSCSLYPYKLCSVVVHSGHTCEAGHYYSYALDTSRSGSDSKRHQWYCFNDENTYETSYKDFVEREKSSVTDTTYIVIYMIDKPGIDEVCEQTEAPAEMITRVQQDNRKYLLVIYLSTNLNDTITSLSTSTSETKFFVHRCLFSATFLIFLYENQFFGYIIQCTIPLFGEISKAWGYRCILARFLKLKEEHLLFFFLCRKNRRVPWFNNTVRQCKIATMMKMTTHRHQEIVVLMDQAFQFLEIDSFFKNESLYVYKRPNE